MPPCQPRLICFRGAVLPSDGWCCGHIGQALRRAKSKLSSQVLSWVFFHLGGSGGFALQKGPKGGAIRKYVW